mgnify:CR=1 FL=1
MLILLAAALAQAACPEATTATDLVTAVGRADGTFAAMDLGGFQRAREEVLTAVICLDEVITPADAAAAHRVEALDAFVDDEEGRGLGAFAASLSIQPGFKLSTRIAPDGHPLRDWFERARLRADGAPLPMAPPRDGLLYVDEVRSQERPAARPAIVQLVDGGGAVAWTSYVEQGGALPTYEVGRRTARDPSKRRVNVPMLVTSGVLLVASGAMYGAAVSTRGRFDDPNTPYEDLSGLRATSNGLVIAASGTAAAGLGFGITAVAVSW